MKKIKITRISNEDDFNIIDIEKSEVFLNNLQDFVVDVGLAKAEDHDYEGKSYDLTTFYTLFYEDEKKDFELRRLHINEFTDGTIVRYSNKDIELLIIFFYEYISLIFYCDQKNRKKIMGALYKFCEIEKPKP